MVKCVRRSGTNFSFENDEYPLYLPYPISLVNMNYTLIAQQASVSDKQARNTIALFEEGATVPFIARYRKEATGGLDEVQIGNVKEAWQKQQEVEKRREAILKSIEEQGKLTAELKKRSRGCFR